MKNALILVLAMVLSIGLVACGSSGGGVKMCVGTCSADSNCPTGTKCDTSGTKECVACLADSDCTTGVKACYKTTGSCKFCSTDTECTVGTTKIMTGKCDATGQCNKCTADTDCTYTGSVAKVCGSAGTCVMCKVDADCGTGKKCTTTAGFAACFTPCTVDTDCTVTGFTCDTGSGMCSCPSDAACKSAYPGSNLNWTCQ